MNTPPSVEPPQKPRRIGLPLRLEGLAARVAGRPGADDVMRRAVEMDRRTNDVAHRVGQPGLPSEQRAQLNLELASLQLELSDLIASSLGEPRPEARSRSALAELQPGMRQHLANLLRVPADRDFEALLELKAAEYLEQGRAFDQVATEFGFLDGVVLGAGEARGALILTHNGSLVQLSAPGVDGEKSARRYVYQNIYGGPAPTEGAMSLIDPVRVGKPMRASRMATSPVRRLRLAVRASEWEEARQTFRHVSVTLMRARSPQRSKTLWGADPGWHPVVHARSMNLERAEVAGRGARVELADLLSRFADPAHPPCDAVLEAQIVGLMIHVQGSLVEAGEPGRTLAEVSTFVTDRGERCVVEKGRIRVERPSRPALEITGANIGAQAIVRGAPLALIDASGDIMVVLGDVVGFSKWCVGSTPA